MNNTYTNYKSLVRRIVFAMAFLFLMMINVNAETITYNVCKSGCEYENIRSLNDNHRPVSEEDDIIINIMDDYPNDPNIYTSLSDIMVNSVTLNGNGHNLEYVCLYTHAKNVYINNFGKLGDLLNNDIINLKVNNTYFRMLRLDGIKNVELNNVAMSYNTFNNIDNLVIENVNNMNDLEMTNIKKLKLRNSFIKELTLSYEDSNNNILNDELLLNEIIDIDATSFSNLKALALVGNFKIQNMNFSHALLALMGGKLDIYNSSIGKTLTFNLLTNSEVNIYNSNFKSLKYKNYPSMEEITSVIETLEGISDFSLLPYDINDISDPSFDGAANTKVFFDKIAKIKLNDRLDLTKWLDYYTDDKEISYIIEDETIAKIENKKLIGLKPGSTKVQVTTDDGHVIYNIDLTVEPLNSGTIEKKDQKENNYAEADFSSDELNSIIPLTSDEQAIKDSGKNIEVFLKVEDISSSILDEDKKLVDSKLESNEVLGAYLDASLFKQVEGQNATKIEETNGNIKVSMKLPDSLLNKDKSKLRTYYILRLHNGIVDKLETELNEDTLTFETNKFSTYALVYEDINNPQTGDNIIVFVVGFLLSITIIYINMNYYKRLG